MAEVVDPTISIIPWASHQYKSDSITCQKLRIWFNLWCAVLHLTCWKLID